MHPQLIIAMCAAVAVFAWMTLWRRSKSVESAKRAELRCLRSHQLSPTFSIRGLTKHYPSPAGPVTAIRDINIDIHRGVTAIVGPSGGGKTTMLNCVGGLDTPTSGQIWVRGERLDFDDSAAMRRHRGVIVAWVFQELNLFSHQTVVENVALPLLCRGEKRRSALAKAQRTLDCLNLGHLAGRGREQLSRGQQQRVAIARAFASDAAVVLADEPTGSLDPQTAESIMRAFRRMSDSEQKPVVLVTHNHDLARKYCDRVLLCTTEGLTDLAEETSAKSIVQAFVPDTGGRQRVNRTTRRGR